MVEDLDHKIIKQIEYYFGDYNLPKDKFLQKQITLDDGWVEITVLLTFKRLASLTTNPEVIVEALKKSENGIVDVSEDGKKIRRNPNKPFPQLTEEREKEIMNRTAYTKGFPLDESLDDIMVYLEQHGPIEACTKRSYLDKATNEHNFKGSCFIVFKKTEDCKTFIEAESIKYKDQDLLRKWQTDYINEKKQEIQNRKHDKKKKKEDRVKLEEQAITFPKGAILYFSGIGDDQILTWEEVKAKIKEIGEIEPAYIDFKKEDKQGHVRMPNENDAVEFYKKLTDGKLEVGEVKLQIKVLEGDEEKVYLDKTTDIMRNRRQNQKKGRKPHHRLNNKRKGNDGDSPSLKKIKT